MHWTRTILKSLTVPGGFLLVGVALLVGSGWFTLAVPAISFLYYCALVGAWLLAWRFHSSRIFFAALVLFLAQQAVSLAGGPHAMASRTGWAVLTAVATLVPLNFILIALVDERGFNLQGIAPVGLFVFVQMIFVAVLANATESAPATPLRSHHGLGSIPLPGYVLFLFIAAGLVLLPRLWLLRKPADGALFWSLAAYYLAVHFASSERLGIIYAATAMCILAVSVIETSYLLAYHDELTSLPSRRAFNQALLRLNHPYCIAAVDIDHFKRFNDTYGHDTGDEVLRLVASKLARVSGGGEAFRCGGEEFSILFPGKTATEVASHLERLRVNVQDAEFRMRGGDDRRHVSRGPDRRERRSRSARQKAVAIRELSQDKSRTGLSVTISIGLAASSSEKNSPDVLLQAADKALYQAKANGRNRLEIAVAARRTDRAKAAGIA